MALVVRQFAWAAELDTSLHRSLTALAGACADEFALELSKPSEHGEQCGVVVSAHASLSDLKPAPA